MRSIFTLLWLVVAATVAAGQSSVKLTWQDSINPAAVSYNAYRAVGSCQAGNLQWVKLNASPVSAKEYTDGNVTPGIYCYRVTAFLDGLGESAPSNTAEALSPLAKPQGLTITVSVQVTVQSASP